MESVAEEILRGILLRLPTRDVVRGRRVCRQWRDLLTDPSFVNVHGHASHVTPGAGGAAGEALAVSETRGRGIGLEMVVVSLASANPMCQVSDLAAPYSPVSACNGYLLLAPRKKGSWPVFVCNPISGAGENLLKVRAPPRYDQYRRTYAMGFSPSCRQYKLFCFTFWEPDGDGFERESDLDVLTLGDGNGNRWLQHPHVFPYRVENSLHSSPPVSVDGKLYMVAIEPYLMIEIDVATEEHRTYPLPPEEYPQEVYPFEMRGRLCVAVRGLGDQRLYFWFMRSAPMMQSELLAGGGDDDDDQLDIWELCYTFVVHNDDFYALRGAWHDDSSGMLCYWLGDDLYKYDTTKRDRQLTADSVLEWDQQTHLPATMPPPEESDWGEVDDYKHRWNVYGGYRPGLLSPRLAFGTVTSLQQDDNALLRALRCQQETQEQLLHHED